MQTQHRRATPPLFALKELISPTVFPLGKNANIRDYLPLNEAAIQRYMKHSAIVETYWADVRYLDPKTNQPIELGLSELDGQWTPLDDVDDMEQTMTAPRPSVRYKEVKLQMRIAMEHCDLGASPVFPTFPQQHTHAPPAGCVTAFSHQLTLAMPCVLFVAAHGAAILTRFLPVRH